MKTKFKVLVMALCLSLFAVESQAQAIIFSFSAGTSEEPAMKFKGNKLYDFRAGATYEHILTRHFSIRSGLLFSETDLSYRTNDYFISKYGDEQSYRYDGYVDYLSMPLGAEYKVLLLNRVRLYVNANLMLNFKIWDSSSDYWYDEDDDLGIYADKKCDSFSVGASTGLGIEFGFLRIGLRYDSDFTKICNALDKPIQSLSLEGGVRFGGNKRFRTKSKAKTASVPYSILDPQTVTATTPKTEVAATQKTTVAPTKSAAAKPMSVVVKDEPVTVVEEPTTQSESSYATMRYVRIGMNFAKIANEYDSPDYNNMRKLGYYFSYGFHKPITIMGVNNLYWGTEFALGTRGYKEKYSEDGYTSKYTLQAHNIQAAQNIGYKYKLPILKVNLTVDAHLGIYASYDYAGKFVDEYNGGEEKYEETISELNKWYKDEYGERAYNRGDIGIAYGFGVWYNNKYNFEFAFQNGLVNPYHDTDYKYRSRNFMIRLGYAF